ncbi:hypothetical protein LWI29_031657 [Acer saccharum]|uniref:Pentatricopeptide repeat-containing protein n=1 Tax=Acer saccharum TaxID=4024 RepID=A0AA39VEM6_ACESA|nr:hypothetical protein LWI29_031657 [Acer saccharum]
MDVICYDGWSGVNCLYKRRARRHVQPALPEFSESNEGGIRHRRYRSRDSSTDEEVEQWILGEPKFAAQPSSPHTHTLNHIPTKPLTSIPYNKPITKYISNPPPPSPSPSTHSHSPNQFSTCDTQSTKTPLLGDQPIDPTPQCHETHKNPNHQFTNTQIDSPQNPYAHYREAHKPQFHRFENTPENQFEINKTPEESKAERLICTFSLEEEELLNSIDRLLKSDDESMAAETQEISAESSTIDVYDPDTTISVQQQQVESGSNTDTTIHVYQYDSALHIFNSMPRRSLVSYNTMMSGYLRNDDFDLAREVFDKIPEGDLVSWNVMISGYLRNKNLSEARELFEAMTCRNVGSWNTMITGYAQSGEITLARNLFDRSP